MFRIINHNIPEISAQTTDSGRIYTTPNGNYPSVTTVLDKVIDKSGIEEWKNKIGHDEAAKILRSTANRGTGLHTICEAYLKNEFPKPFKYMPTVWEMFTKIKPFIDENVSEIHGIELGLWSDILKIAGRTDAIVRWNGLMTIGDFKTKRREQKEEWLDKHFLQCGAYAVMFQERTGIMIDNAVLLCVIEDGSTQIVEKNLEKYRIEVVSLIRKYHLTFDLPK